MPLNNTLAQDKPFVTVGQDGLSDYNGTDLATLQAAFDYVHSLGGGVVYIKKGTYTINNELIFYDNMEVYGEGEKTVIKLADNTNGSPTFPLGFIGLLRNNDTVSGNSNIFFHDFKIDGNQANGNGDGNYNYGIWCTKGTNFRAQNMTIDECSSCGISCNQVTKVFILNNLITGMGACAIGIAAGDNSYIHIDGNTLLDSDDEAIDCNNGDARGTTVIITNNHCETSNNSDESGIELSYNSYGMEKVIISNNTCTDFWNGIYIRGLTGAGTGDGTQQEMVIANNICHDNRDCGIEIYDQSQKMTVVGNVTYNNVTAGIHIQTSSNISLTGNVCKSEQSHGIYIEDSNDVNVVSSNIIDAGGHGIFIEDSYNITASNNIIDETDAAFDGINITSTYVGISKQIIVNGNNAHGCRYGIYFDKAINFTCNSNIVTENTEDGIRVSGGDGSIIQTYSSISENVCLRNTKQGMSIIRVGSMTITGNNCQLNGRHGLSFQYVNYSTISGNQINMNNTSQSTYSGLIGSRLDYSTVISNTCVDTAAQSNENLTADAASGQAVLTVADTREFQVGQIVTISDTTPQSEDRKILSIDSATQMTLTANLTNTYTTANTANVTGKAVQAYGINLDANCDHVVLLGNIAKNNVTADISDSSVSSEVAHNLTT